MHALALVLLAFGAPAPSQGAPPALVEEAPAAATVAVAPADRTPEEAERLLEEANGLLDDLREWGRAARLFERSAELRPADDAVRATAYRMAGHLYAYVKSYERAERAFRNAAEAAAAIGAVAEAAGAYVDAAHVAVRLRNPEAARDLLRKSSLLAHSPHLSARERQLILDRIPAAGES